jgi:hypothetical protein
VRHDSSSDGRGLIDGRPLIRTSSDWLGLVVNIHNVPSIHLHGWTLLKDDASTLNRDDTVSAELEPGEQNGCPDNQRDDVRPKCEQAVL